MWPESEIQRLLEGEELLAKLASFEHERWAHWQQYLHAQCKSAADGSLVIPPELVARWTAQIETKYSDLTDEEQESDREQVRLYLPVILDALRDGIGDSDRTANPE